MLPPGWERIPLRGDIARSVRAVVDRGFGDQPRDRTLSLRHALERDLLVTARDAQRVSGIDLYLWLSSPGERPVDASLVVSALPGSDDVVSVEELVEEMSGQHEEVSVVSLPLAGPAVRLLDRVEPRDDAPVRTVVTRLHYLVSVPPDGERPRGRLLLSFSTTTAPLAGPLTELFDAVAGTLGFA